MSGNRKTWTNEEDHLLTTLISEIGITKWGVIAKKIEEALKMVPRTGKQCRERWHNHLDPAINKEAWTDSEKKLILQLHNTYGNHWSRISAHLPGRTDNQIKNFYYSSLRKNYRKITKVFKFHSKSKKKIFKPVPVAQNTFNQSLVLDQDLRKVENIEEEASLILCSMHFDAVTDSDQKRDLEEKRKNQSFSQNYPPEIYVSYVNYCMQQFSNWMILKNQASV